MERRPRPRRTRSARPRSRRPRPPPRSRRPATPARTSTRSRARPLDDRARPFLELGALAAVELLPGRQRAWISTVDEEDPVQMIDLVLEGAGRQAALDLDMLGALPVEVRQTNAHVPLQVAAQVRHR